MRSTASAICMKVNEECSSPIVKPTIAVLRLLPPIKMVVDFLARGVFHQAWVSEIGSLERRALKFESSPANA